MQVTSEHVKILFVSHRLHVMSLRYKLLWKVKLEVMLVGQLFFFACRLGWSGVLFVLACLMLLPIRVICVQSSVIHDIIGKRNCNLSTWIRWESGGFQHGSPRRRCFRVSVLTVIKRTCRSGPLKRRRNGDPVAQLGRPVIPSSYVVHLSATVFLLLSDNKHLAFQACLRRRLRVFSFIHAAIPFG